MVLGESSRRSTLRTGLIALATAAFAVSLSTTVATVAAAPATAATPVAPLGIAAGGKLQWASQAERDTYFSTARDLGATWIRMDFPWADIQRSAGGGFDFARYDKVVADAKRYGLNVVALLGYAPRWAQDSSCAGANTCHPRSATEYGTYAGAVAQHFASRGLHHYEIWNEPNVAQWYAPKPNPTEYAALLKAAYSRIHAGDPQARVIFAGAAPAATGGGNYSPIDFLSAVYSAGGGKSFDILGTHPYCFAGSFDCPRQPETWSAWTQMADTKTSMRSVMSAHGDSSKHLWATEFGAPTNGSGATSEAQQAQTIVNGLKLFGQDAWSGPLFVYSLKDNGTNTQDREDWFGILRADGSRKPAFNSVRSLMSSSAQRPVGGGGSGGGGTTTQPDPAPAQPTATPSPTSTQVPDSQGTDWWSWLIKWLFA